MAMDRIGLSFASPILDAMDVGPRSPYGRASGDPSTQMGIPSLAPTQADAAIFGEQLRKGAGLSNVPGGVEGGAPVSEGLGAPGGAAYIPYSPSTQKFWIGGRLVDAASPGEVAASQALIGQPSPPAPAEIATDWTALSPAAYGQYVSKLKTPRGFGANVALGARGLAEQTLGGVGDILSVVGAPSVGEPIARFAESTFGQTKAEQERSALIQQSNSTLSNIWDAVAQGLPSVGLSIVSGGLGAVGGAAAAARFAGAAANLGRARTLGALTGLAASTYPSEFQNFYEAAKNAKNPDGTPAYNINDPMVGIEIAAAAGGTTLLQTIAEGKIASGFSKFFSDEVKRVGEQVTRSTIGRVAAGGAKGAASEAFAEGVTQLAQQAVFDPEFRRQLNASDWKALAPYVIEKYGENALIAAGAGAVLGGAFGAAFSGKAPLQTFNSVNLLEGAGAPKPEAPSGVQLELPLEGPQGPQLELPMEMPRFPAVPTTQPTLPAAPAPGQLELPLGQPVQLELPLQQPVTQPGAGELPLFGFSSGVLQATPGTQLELPLTGGAGVAPAIETAPTQLELPLGEPQPELPLPPGMLRLRRGAQIRQQTGPQARMSLAAQARETAAFNARREAAKVALLPVQPLSFTETPTAEALIEMRTRMEAEQKQREALLKQTKRGRDQLTKMAAAQGITYKEAERIVKGHRNAGERALKQLAKYIADPASVPVVQTAPAPVLTPVTTGVFTPVVAAPVQPTEVPNAAPVGQVQQSGQPQYTGVGGQVPSVGPDRNVTPQIQEGGGEAGGGNLPVEGGPQPEALASVTIGTNLDNVTFLSEVEPRIANIFKSLIDVVGLSKKRIFFAIVNKDTVGEYVRSSAGTVNVSTSKRGQLYTALSDMLRGDSYGRNVSYPDGSHLIMLRSEGVVDPGQLVRLLETMSHEIGHAVEFTLLDNATDAELFAILSDYKKFLDKVSGLPSSAIAEVMESTMRRLDAISRMDLVAANTERARLSKIFKAAVPQAKGTSVRNLISALRASQMAKESLRGSQVADVAYTKTNIADKLEYWLGFNEWFADQTSKWATTQAKPLTLVEKFFKRLGDRLKRLYEAGRSIGLPAQSVADFLDRMGPPNFIEGVTTEPTPPGGGISNEAAARLEPTLTEDVVARITPEENAAANARIDNFIETNVPKPLRSMAYHVAYNLRDMSIKGAYFMAFGRDLRAWVEPMLPSVGQYFDGVQKRNTLLEQLKREVDVILQKTNSLNAATSEQVNQFLADSTLRQAWGYQPAWLDEPVEIDPRARAAYDAMPREAREIADSIFRKNYEDMRRMRAAIVEQIRAGLTGPEFDSLPDADKKRLQDEAAIRLRLMDSYLKERKGPYAALSRFGKYITVAKSQRLVALENVPVENRDPDYAAQLDALKSNPDDYIVIFSDSFGAAKAKQQELRTQFPNMQTGAFEKQDVYRQVQVPQWMAMQQIRTIIEKNMQDNPELGFGKKELDVLNSFIMDLYVGTLAENSARRHQLARVGVAGFDNMLRAFAVGGVANAHFIGSMNFEPEIAGALRQMSAEATSQGGATPRADRIRAYKEVMARHIGGIGTEPTPVQDTLLRYNSVWTLLTLPRYYILNGSQTYMLSMPVMAAKFGYGKTFSAINDTYRDMAFSFSKATGGTGAALKQFFSGEFDLTKLKRPDGKPYSAEEIRFLETLRDTGLMDIGMGYDLGYWEANQTPGPNRGLQRALQKLTAATRQIEVINRVSSGLSAYRLARETMSAADATAYASKIVSDTQGDYSGINAPRLFNAFSFSKLILQFRKYQLMQASLLIKNLHAAFAGASEDERKLGRAILRNVLGQTALVTGALGLPLAGTVSYILAAIFGPPDEPVDEERFLRRAIGNDALADLILNGVPAGLGVDVSAQLGLNNTFSLAPYTDLDFAGRDAFAKSVVGLGGPIFGTLASFADGYKYMTEGQVDKGIEAMMPNGIKSAMRAYRETFDKGVTRRNGDLVMSAEEFNFFDTFLQTLGFTTSRMKDVKRQRQDMYEFDKYFSDRTTEIRRNYVKAKTDNDPAGIAAARADWEALQIAKRRVGATPSSMSNLISAPKQQLRREQKYREQLRKVARSVDMEEAED